jgi:trimeric autotransporter adhesin
MKTKNGLLSVILGLMLIPSCLFGQGIIISSNAYVTANSGYVIVTGNMANSGTLNLQAGIFTMSGNYTNSCTYTQGTGSVVFNGQGQVLSDNGSGTMFSNVFFSGNGGSGTPAVMSSGNFSVSNTGVLTMVNTTSLNANGHLTLNSAAASSATVAAIPSAATITGNVNVQRYINGGSSNYRGYRLLSSPVYTATVSSNNVYSVNYLKNSIYLTGTSITGGMDNVAAAHPTLYLYRENMTPSYSTFLNSNFRGINNINSSPDYGMDDAAYPTANIEAGNGFLCFFRGDRSSASYAAETTTSYVPQPATLSATGTLNQGSIAVTPWFASSGNTLSYTAGSPAAIKGFNLVGNPYASSIDWDQFSNSSSSANIYGPNVGITMYVLDPVSDNYGAYQAGTGGSGSNHSTNIIPSGLGFFVIAGASFATLTFKEGAKTNTQASGVNLLMGKPVNAANNQYLRLQLAEDSVNTEDILIRFNQSATTAYDETLDAPYRMGYGKVNMCSISDNNVALAINYIPLPKTGETIGLMIRVNTDGIYSLNMKSLAGLPELFDIWLMDAYRKDSLDMRHNSTYNFNVSKSDTNSSGSKRFSLVIRQNPAYAYRLLSFTASKVATATDSNKRVLVAWTTENEQNYTNFAVERSTDGGKTFSTIGGLASNGMGTYSLLDKNAYAGLNFYRLKQDDINNTTTYSNTVQVMYANTSNGLATLNVCLYPNPAINVINLSITAKSKESTIYNVMISNSSGIIVKQATLSQPSWQTGINNLLPGTYLLQVVNDKDKSLVGQTKFVKL